MYLVVAEFDEIGVFCVPNSDERVYFFDQFLLLVVFELHVPLGQARFTGSVLYQYKPDHSAKHFMVRKRKQGGNAF